MYSFIKKCFQNFFVKAAALIFLSFPATAVLGNSSNIDNKLSELEQKTGLIQSVQADFIQKKKLLMFTKEMIIDGKIYIAKPDLFSWHVYKPIRYGLVVKDNEISQWNADTDRVKTISMKDNPAFTAIFDQMNNWLSGSYKSLKNDYNINIISELPLTLKFVPLKTASSFKFISSITVYFNSDLRYLKEILIEEKNGDRTSLSFSDIILNGKISGNAWSAKF